MPNKNFPYTGKSFSVKVLENKRVNLTGKLKDILRLRHGKTFNEIPFWTYVPVEESREDLVCQLLESTPKENHSKYELTTINNSGGFRLHPDSKIRKGSYVEFIGEGDHIDIVKARKRKGNKRTR